MPMPSMPSRPSAPEVFPIEHDGVRYEQDKHDDRDGDQPGGYLAAIDMRTGKRLWRIKVYTIAPQSPSGPGRPAIYFRSMQLGEGGESLIVENEAGGVYRVDLSSHTSIQVSGPPETAPEAPAGRPKPTSD